MGRKGALPSVLRAIGMTPVSAGAPTARTGQVALCALCTSTLDFDTNALTQLIERCSGTKNPHCPNRRWHRRPVDPSILLPPEPPASERKRRGRPPGSDPRQFHRSTRPPHGPPITLGRGKRRGE